MIRRLADPAALRRPAAAAFFVATTFCTAVPARADPVIRDWPCAGCMVLPAAPDRASEPAPLVVLLHGDEGSPARMFAAWRATAAARKVVLFAPRCPRDRGCAGSFWRWDGDPSWLFEQLDAVGAKHPIDVERSYLAGWSGGATWATFRARRWGERFAAVALAGGGVVGSETECAPCPYTVEYLTGTNNPLHHLAVAARDALLRCGHDVRWTELAGADHGGEWRAYATEQQLGGLLDRLLATPRRACGSDAGGASSADSGRAADAASADAASAGDAGAGDASAGAPTAQAPVAGATAPPPPRCGCAVPGGEPGGGAAAFVGAMATTLIARRRARGRAPADCPEPARVGSGAPRSDP